MFRHGTSYKLANGVSFSVYVKATELKLGSGQTVIFDGVLTNDGNGYDDRTGVFTCPVAGNYMIVVDSHSPGPTCLQIYLNRSKVASLYVSTYHESKTYLQMSRTVILKLQKGDRVKVVNLSIGTIHHRGFSGFSGTRLY